MYLIFTLTNNKKNPHQKSQPLRGNKALSSQVEGDTGKYKVLILNPTVKVLYYIKLACLGEKARKNQGKHIISSTFPHGNQERTRLGKVCPSVYSTLDKSSSVRAFGYWGKTDNPFSAPATDRERLISFKWVPNFLVTID